MRVHDLRQGSLDNRRTVDDSPFGGGPGMVLMPEPVFRCVEAVEAAGPLPRPLLLLAPGGRPFSTSRWRPSWPRSPGGSRFCAAATRGSTSG